MKSSYEVRAERFLRVIYPLIAGATDPRMVSIAISKYNHDHHRKVVFDYGSTRMCLITSDYVIKWDYSEDVEDFGGCLEELTFYEYAKQEGYSAYFAKPTACYIEGNLFEIMPRMYGVGHKEDDIFNAIPADDFDWLWDNVDDLHELNIGFFHGSMIIIDYACNRFNRCSYGG